MAEVGQEQTQSTTAATMGAAESILSDPVTQTKLTASLVLLLVTLLCGYLPVRVIVNQNYIQHAMFAGGGVLMATAFCHLIPEAHDSYRASGLGPLAEPHGHHQNHSPQGLSQDNGHEHLQQPQAQLQRSAAAANQSAGQTNFSSSALPSDMLKDLKLAADEWAPGGFLEKINGLNVPYLELTLCCGFFFMYLVEQLMLRFINNHTHEHHCDTSAGQLVVGAGPQSSSSAPSAANLAAGDSSSFAGSSTVCSTSVGDLSTTVITPGSLRNRTGGATELYKFIRGLFIVSAFGMHSIFDGVAIGSQDSVEKVWTIFAAISCHKLIIAAVVGLELFAATLESHLWTLVHLVIFSSMSPIGIILVVLAQSSFRISSDHPAMILLQSFATGTLLYIIFVEILQPKEDQHHAKGRLGASFSLIAGFALMLTVLTLVNGSSRNCLFNELTIDHKHVKYQSALNSSWFIGFDARGNTLSFARQYHKSPSDETPPAANSPKTKLDTRESQRQLRQKHGSKASQQSASSAASQGEADNAQVGERCFQFTKMNSLTTSTQFFPEAFDLIDGHQTLAGKLEGDSQTAANATQTTSKLFQSAELALKAKKRAGQSTTTLVHSLNQRQIFNMTRYRNILRYQLGRRANQSILPESNSISSNNNNNHGSGTPAARTWQQLSNINESSNNHLLRSVSA